MSEFRHESYGEMTEEARKRLEDAVQKQRLAVLEFQRGLYELVEDLEEENLQRLKNMLTVISHAENAEKQAYFWLSWTQHELKNRFGVDPVGQMVDDDELQDWMDE